jgi:hypothetical protein
MPSEKMQRRSPAPKGIDSHDELRVQQRLDAAVRAADERRLVTAARVRQKGPAGIEYRAEQRDEDPLTVECLVQLSIEETRDHVGGEQLPLHAGGGRLIDVLANHSRGEGVRFGGFDAVTHRVVENDEGSCRAAAVIAQHRRKDVVAADEPPRETDRRGVEVVRYAEGEERELFGRPLRASRA